MGLVGQFSVWVPDMAPATVSMRALLRENTAFMWTPECQVEFELIKSVLSDKWFIKARAPENLKLAGN